MSLLKLIELFSDFKIYPQDDFKPEKSKNLYEKSFPGDPYIRGVNEILKKQPPTSINCADLPWWGVNYFDESLGKRIMAISQDTTANEAGSIALHAHLMGKDNLDPELIKDKWKNMEKFKEFFDEFLINYNYLYVTDAGKVRRKKESITSKKHPIDRKKSKELLEKEIEICNPDLIILFGIKPADLLKLECKSDNNLPRNFSYNDIQSMDKPIDYKGRKIIISPFLSGNGRYGKGRKKEDFKNSYRNALKLIKDVLE